MNFKPNYDARTGRLLGITRLLDGASIPLCEDNMDYQQYLKDVPEAYRFSKDDLTEIVIPGPARDLAAEIDKIKDEIKALKERKSNGLEHRNSTA